MNKAFPPDIKCKVIKLEREELIPHPGNAACVGHVAVQNIDPRPIAMWGITAFAVKSFQSFEVLRDLMESGEDELTYAEIEDLCKHAPTEGE